MGYCRGTAKAGLEVLFLLLFLCQVIVNASPLWMDSKGLGRLEGKVKIMFTNISWANYLVVVTLFLSAYYLITVIYFYSRDLQYYLTRMKKRGIRAGPDQLEDTPVVEGSDAEFSNMEAEAFSLQDPVARPSGDSLQEVEQLIAHLKEAIGEVKTKKYSKEEFILLLQLVLKEYPAFRGSPFQSAIRDLIISECKKQDSISLTEEDVLVLLHDTS